MKTQILVIGRHRQILETVLRLINQHPDWLSIGAGTDEEAIHLFKTQRFDLVLLSSGIEEESETKLRMAFLEQDPDVTIIQHYGGGSGLLMGEVLQALAEKKK